MNGMLKNTINKKGGAKLYILVLAVAVIGISIMLLAKGGDSQSGEESDFEALDPAKYAEQIEERVEELCNRVDGVSSTYAVVTLSGGYRAIYATDMQSGSSNSKNQTVILGNGSAEKGLLIGYENPEIAGIGIVCSGGDDYNIRKNIISVVASAFDVPSNKIFVAGS